ncbi:MAG: hypothetical protein GXO85_07575 [Chlorobi bacterium]|nr:hypothetical protein [Chlorobiota bacterium]
MNIFYSWQVDTPDKIGKSFIRFAIDEAVTMLSEDMELDEAERPSVDQDTQGVMGSPAIAETIFEKIRNSQVVIVDVTLVGETSSGKKLINSNVAYELGFAHGHHGDHVLLSIMNTHYGSPDNLPFDLKHRRWPVRFEISPESDKNQRNKVKSKLVKELSAILKLYLENRKPVRKYDPIPVTLNPASYWQENEYIVQRTRNDDRDEDINLGYSKNQPLIYLRLWPDELLPDLSGKDFSNHKISIIEPLLGRAGGYSSCRNKYGSITYSGENSGQLISTTQLFKNREIWGVEAFILHSREGRDFDFVPTAAFETGLIRSLNAYLNAAYERLGYTHNVHVEAGLVNVEGFKLAMPNDYWERFWGPIFEDITVNFTVNKNDPESVNNGLLKVFEAVFDSAGSERPANLGGFPVNVN